MGDRGVRKFGSVSGRGGGGGAESGGSAVRKAALVSHTSCEFRGPQRLPAASVIC